MKKGSSEDFLERPSCMTAFDAFCEYPSFLSGKISENAIEILGKVFPIGKVSLLSEAYLGKEVIAGFRPSDFSLSETGFSAEVKGKFRHGKENISSLRSGGQDLFVASEREISVGEIVSVGISCVTGLFDPINERTIVRY